MVHQTATLDVMSAINEVADYKSTDDGSPNSWAPGQSGRLADRTLMLDHSGPWRMSLDGEQ